MPIDNEYDDLLRSRDIDNFSQELANRGPTSCEQQIRYIDKNEKDTTKLSTSMYIFH
jgi:hypothetical protein